MHRKYVDLEPIKRLRFEGRELLGKPLYVTVKRDGENVCVWRNEVGEFIIGSRNNSVAEGDIQSRMKNTPEWENAKALINDEFEEYNARFIPFGELLKKVSPTRVEPQRKHIHWIMFDIWDLDNECWLPYNKVYQLGHEYGIPVVELLEIAKCNNLDELQTMVAEHLKWCRRHKREGVVIKCYNAYDLHDSERWAFVKEKINLPEKVKIRYPDSNKILLPLMDEEKCLRALQHAYDEVGEENWKDVKVAMPIVAKHFQLEAREHMLQAPKNPYDYWLNTPLELIKGLEKV